MVDAGAGNSDRRTVAMPSLLIDTDNSGGRPAGFFAWQVAAQRRLTSVVIGGKRIEVVRIYRRGTYKWVADTSHGKRYVELDGGPGGKWVVTKDAPAQARRKKAA